MNKNYSNLFKMNFRRRKDQKKKYKQLSSMGFNRVLDHLEEAQFHANKAISRFLNEERHEIIDLEFFQGKVNKIIDSCHRVLRISGESAAEIKEEKRRPFSLIYQKKEENEVNQRIQKIVTDSKNSLLVQQRKELLSLFSLVFDQRHLSDEKIENRLVQILAQMGLETETKDDIKDGYINCDDLCLKGIGSTIKYFEDLKDIEVMESFEGKLRRSRSLSLLDFGSNEVKQKLENKNFSEKKSVEVNKEESDNSLDLSSFVKTGLETEVSPKKQEKVNFLNFIDLGIFSNAPKSEINKSEKKKPDSSEITILDLEICEKPQNTAGLSPKAEELMSPIMKKQDSFGDALMEECKEYNNNSPKEKNHLLSLVNQSNSKMITKGPNALAGYGIKLHTEIIQEKIPGGKDNLSPFIIAVDGSLDRYVACSDNLYYHDGLFLNITSESKLKKIKIFSLENFNEVVCCGSKFFGIIKNVGLHQIWYNGEKLNFNLIDKFSIQDAKMGKCLKSGMKGKALIYQRTAKNSLGMYHLPTKKIVNFDSELFTDKNTSKTIVDFQMLGEEENYVVVLTRSCDLMIFYIGEKRVLNTQMIDLTCLVYKGKVAKRIKYTGKNMELKLEICPKGQYLAVSHARYSKWSERVTILDIYKFNGFELKFIETKKLCYEI